MMTDYFPKTEPSGMNQELRSSSNYDQPSSIPPIPRWRLGLNLIQDTNPKPVASRQVDYWAFERRLAGLLKLERQYQDRLSAVALDQTAQKLLNALNLETSVKWEGLPDKADCDWSEASKAAALLVGANLCEVSPTRIRLSEYGDRLLAESSPADEALPEVAS